MGGCTSNTEEHATNETYKLAILPSKTTFPSAEGRRGLGVSQYSHLSQGGQAPEFSEKEINVSGGSKIITCSVVTLLVHYSTIHNSTESQALKGIDGLLAIIEGDQMLEIGDLRDRGGADFIETVRSKQGFAWNNPVVLVVVSQNGEFCMAASAAKALAEKYKWKLEFVPKLEQIDSSIVGAFTELMNKGVSPKARRRKTEVVDFVARQKEEEESKNLESFIRRGKGQESASQNRSTAMTFGQPTRTVINGYSSSHNNNEFNPNTKQQLQNTQPQRLSVFDDSDVRILDRERDKNQKARQSLMNI